MKNKGLNCLIILGLIPLIMGFLGKFNWVFDLFSHFRLYYLCYFMVLVFLGILLKNKWQTISSASIAIALIFSFFDFYKPRTLNEVDNGEGLNIVSINLLSSNTNVDTVLTYIAENDFDILFFQEFTPEWEYHLFKILERYPFSYSFPQHGVYGIAFFSKLEIKDHQILAQERGTIFANMIEVEFEEERLVIIGMHPPPPISKSLFDLRNLIYDSVSKTMEESEYEIVLIGDMNTTSFSPNFDRLINNEQLVDTRRGFGLLASWNARWKFTLITLDHAFVTKGLNVLNRGVGNDVGSDHLPITLQIKRK